MGHIKAQITAGPSESAAVLVDFLEPPLGIRRRSPIRLGSPDVAFGRLATPLALDGIEVIGIDIARYVTTIETGGIKNRQVAAQGGDRLLEGFDILVNQRISADFGGNLVVVATT